MFLSRFGTLIVALTLSVTVQSKSTFNNTLYIITNAETPSLSLPGLTPVGAQRAQVCLPEIFSSLDIGIIMTCPYDPDSRKCKQTVVTAEPIAQSLGLPLITKCGASEESDDNCVTKTLTAFAANSTQAMLVVWDLGDLDSLFENINVDDNNDEDDDDDVAHVDLLFTVVKQQVTSLVSQGCRGLDGQAPGTFRRRNSRRAIKRQTGFWSRIIGRRP